MAERLGNLQALCLQDKSGAIDSIWGMQLLVIHTLIYQKTEQCHVYIISRVIQASSISNARQVRPLHGLQTHFPFPYRCNIEKVIASTELAKNARRLALKNIIQCKREIVHFLSTAAVAAGADVAVVEAQKCQ